MTLAKAIEHLAASFQYMRLDVNHHHTITVDGAGTLLLSFLTGAIAICLVRVWRP